MLYNGVIHTPECVRFVEYRAFQVWAERLIVVHPAQPIKRLYLWHDIVIHGFNVAKILHQLFCIVGIYTYALICQFYNFVRACKGAFWLCSGPPARSTLIGKLYLLYPRISVYKPPEWEYDMGTRNNFLPVLPHAIYTQFITAPHTEGILWRIRKAVLR